MTARRYNTRGIYKVRKTDPRGSQFSISLPPEYGAKLAGRRFRFTMTDKGILYEPVEDDTVDLPEWAKEDK